MAMKRYIFFLFYLLLVSMAHGQYIHDSLKTDQGYIHYYFKGKGKPVVLLPGGPGFSSYYLRAIADSLTNYKAILIDFQGTGRSQYREPDSSWVNPDNIIKDAELLRKHLAIDKWIVMGQSWATHFALLYGIKHPQHTSRIILLATAGTDNKFQQYYGDNIKKGMTTADYSEIDSLRKNANRGRFDIFKVQFRGYFYDPSKAASFFEMPEEEKPYFFNGSYFMAFRKDPGYDSFDISKETYSMDIPVRIIQGRQDPVNGGTQERLNERLKHSKIFYVERAGHFPWLEQPESFYKYLKECMNN